MKRLTRSTRELTKEQGFTLIELLITLSIIILICTAGSASYSFLIDYSRSHRDRSTLYMLIQNTRQLAIDQSATAVLCPSINQVHCINDWANSLIIFIDKNKNKQRDPEEMLITQFDNLVNTQARINYPKTQIRFNSQGVANYFNGTLSYCYKDSVFGIIISRIGRVRFAQDLDGDHIPDVNYNTPVHCN